MSEHYKTWMVVAILRALPLVYMTPHITDMLHDVCLKRTTLILLKEECSNIHTWRRHSLWIHPHSDRFQFSIMPIWPLVTSSHNRYTEYRMYVCSVAIADKLKSFLMSMLDPNNSLSPLDDFDPGLQSPLTDSKRQSLARGLGWYHWLWPGNRIEKELQED